MFINLLKNVISFIAILVLFGISQVHATPMMTFTGGTGISPDGDTIGGWEFSLTSAITVNGLGFWDDDSDGLDRIHDVGLWTLGRTLLASATVTNGSAAEANGAGPGQWLYEDIAALVLGPGDYVLGATFTYEDPDRGTTGALASTIAGVNFVNARQARDTSFLSFPGEVIGSVNDGVFGANLRVIPAPATLSIFVLGMTGLILCRRRQV